MVCLGFIGFRERAISDGSCKLKRLVEHHHEVILEVFGYTTTVAGGISDDSILIGKYFYCRASVKRVHQHESTVRLGESEPEDSRPLGWRDLRSHIIVRQIHAVVIRLRDFCLV